MPCAAITKQVGETGQADSPAPAISCRSWVLLAAEGKSTADLATAAWNRGELEVDPHARKLVDMWPQVKESYSGDEYVVKIRDKEVRTNYQPLAVRLVPGFPRWRCRALKNTANYCAG
jgi:hypothetical protein